MTSRRFEDLLRETVRAPTCAPPPAIVLPLPQRIGHYRIEARLGGATNDVYRARDESLGRRVALKVLAPFLDGDEPRRARLLREARAAAALTHPNLVVVHEIGEASGRTYVAMELLAGRTLRALLDDRAPAIREALRVAHEIARGLAPAHHAGLVHRHLAPASVLVTADGGVKIGGLGLAHARPPRADLDAPRGRSDYDAPELARSDAPTAAADVFSVGVILRALAGAAAPPPIAALVRRCVERDPNQRIPDGRALVRELAWLVAR